MEWGVRPLSRGEGPPSYTIQLPIFPPETGSLPEMETPAGSGEVAFKLEGRDVTLERRDHFYVLRAKGFSAPAEAEAFLRRIVLGLYLLIIRQKIGLRFEPQSVPVEVDANQWFREWFPEETYGRREEHADGTRTDGGVWPMQTVIYPEHERIVEHKMTWGRLIDPFKTSHLAKAFDVAQKYFDPGGVFGDKRVRLAFRLYAAAQAQTDGKVRFINLVTVLEVLSRRGVSRNTGGSIGARMRDYVYERLYSPRTKLTGLEQVAKVTSDDRIGMIYAVRSDLVHEGEVNDKGGKSGTDRFVEARDSLQLMVPQLLLSELAEHPAMLNYQIPESVIMRDHS